MTGFTPGPWEVVLDHDQEGHETGYARVYAGEKGIVEDYVSTEDARLIAAVHELYAALKALTTLSQNGSQLCFSTQNGIPMGMSRKQEKLVRAALAKAEGR